MNKIKAPNYYCTNPEHKPFWRYALLYAAFLIFASSVLTGCGDNTPPHQQSYYQQPVQQPVQNQQLYDANGNPVNVQQPQQQYYPQQQPSQGLSTGQVVGAVAGAGALAGLAYLAGKNHADSKSTTVISQKPSAPIYQPYGRNDGANKTYTAPSQAKTQSTFAPPPQQTSSNAFVPKAAKSSVTVTPPKTSSSSFGSSKSFFGKKR